MWSLQRPGTVGAEATARESRMHGPGRYLAALVAALGLAFSLAACGGGGGDNNTAISSPLPDAARVRALTGSQPPAETAADQSARIAGIIARADSLIYSTLFAETSDPDIPTLEFRASCSGTRCTLREPTTGASFSRSLSDLGGSGSGGQSQVRTVLTKNGITTREGRDAERESYGAWMQHAFFEVAGGQSVTEEGVRIAGWFGRALGDLTDAGPDVTAQWHGLMVGTPSRGTLRGNTLQGDAALTYTLLTIRSTRPSPTSGISTPARRTRRRLCASTTYLSPMTALTKPA